MRPTTRIIALILAAAATAATPAAAFAKHGADDGPGDDHGGRSGQSDDSGSDDDGGRRGGGDDRGEKRVSGRCTGGSTAKLKVKPDDGRIEAEFEVDQNRNGVTWNVTIRRNGRVAVSTRATTRAQRLLQRRAQDRRRLRQRPRDRARSEPVGRGLHRRRDDLSGSQPPPSLRPAPADAGPRRFTASNYEGVPRCRPRLRRCRARMLQAPVVPPSQRGCARSCAGVRRTPSGCGRCCWPCSRSRPS